MTREQIVNRVMSQFAFPMVVKRNSGTQGQNVFVCDRKQDLVDALSKIYSKKQIAYDHVALVSEYVKPACEYRVVVYQNQVQFVYLKPHHRDEFGGLIRPKMVMDELRCNQLNRIVERLCQYLPIRYAGIDIIETNEGEFKVIEINGSPTYSSFIKENGNTLVIKLFKQILTDFDRQSERFGLA